MQISTMQFFEKIASNANLNTLIISAGGYIIAFKIQAEISL